MGKFLTTSSAATQLPKKGMYQLSRNELYKDDDGTIYMVWRLFWTDHFTWIVSGDWDTRCSHLHDEGCRHHQIIRVKLTEQQLRKCRYLVVKNDEVICHDLPPQFLEVIDVTGHWINNLFYRMLRDADCPKTPKHIQLLYRAGVALNLGWFKTGKHKIDLKNIYNDEWNKMVSDD